MEPNDNQKLIKSKQKKRHKVKRQVLTVPLVHANSHAPTKILPKCAHTLTATDDSDAHFPALPSFVQNSSGGTSINVTTSVSFSKVLTSSPNLSLSGVHTQQGNKFDKEHLPSRNSQNRSNVCPAKNDTQGDTLSSPLREKCRSETSVSRSKITTDSRNISSEMKLPSNKRDTSKSKQDNSASTTPPSIIQKTKSKKKSKKNCKTLQGKVNTISHEQYLAITQPSPTKPDNSKFNTSIEDESEYPTLGTPFKEHSTLVKNAHVSYEEKHLSAPEHDSRKNEDSLSPKKQESPVKNEPKEEKAAPPVKKFNAPIEMNLLDMISNRKMKPVKRSPTLQIPIVKKESISPGHLNVLDSSGPARKRGKEREIPKKPKLSKLKKVILKERVEKRLRIALFSMNKENSIKRLCDNNETDLQRLDFEMKKLNLESSEQKENVLPSSEQTPSVICDSQEQENAKSEEETEEEKMKVRLKCAKKLIHCRKFREYCNHFISEEMDELTNSLISELVRYQDRLFLKDPVKARARRRLICGLREVTKNLKLRKLKLVIVAPDIEEINSEGGLADALNSILDFCENYHTPLVFSLPRRKLGKVCKKKVPLSCVGIFNYEGTEEICKQLLELVDEAKQVYKETLLFVQQNLTPEFIQVLCDEKVDQVQIEALKTSFWELQGR